MLFKRLVRKLMDNPEGGGGGGTPTPETFSREYVHELREENKAQRLKATESEQRAKEATAAAAKATSDAAAAAQQTIDNALKAANERVIRAELKALATAAGIKNMDYLKLADVSAITLDAEGAVVGADKIVEAMQKNMPDLFGAPSTTTNTDKKPTPDDPKPKNAMEMTPEEHAAAKKELLKKRR